MVNEDLGDAAALRREVKRLREELEAARRAAAAGGSASGSLPPDGAPGGTPARIAAAADALAASAATPAAALGASGVNASVARKALIGALRREDMAVKQVLDQRRGHAFRRQGQ